MNQPFLSDVMGVNLKKLNEIFVKHWLALIEEFKKGLLNIGRLSLQGIILFEVFNRTVVKAIIDESKGAHALKEKPPQIWTPYGLMYHLLFHNTEPSIRQCLNVLRSRAITDTIINNEVFQQNMYSSRERVNMDGMKKYSLAVKLEDAITHRDPSKSFLAGPIKALTNVSYSMMSKDVPAVSPYTSQRENHGKWR